MTDRTITRALGWLSLGMGLTLRADLGDRRRARGGAVRRRAVESP